MKIFGDFLTWFYNLFHKEDRTLNKPISTDQQATLEVKPVEPIITTQPVVPERVIKSAYIIARSYLGTKEVRGKKSNKIIQSFYERAVGVIYGDQVPWCAAFVNSCLVEVGLKGTGKLNARSFMKLGEKTNNPKEGDVVVFWRGSRSSWKGHVAFYVCDSGSNIKVLGGNQGDSVSIKKYPKYRILGFRRVE